MSLGGRLARIWRQLFCSHEVALSDYLVVIDEHGIQRAVDYCAVCGLVRPDRPFATAETSGQEAATHGQ